MRHAPFSGSSKPAKMLGVSLKTLHNKLRRYRETGLLDRMNGGSEAPAIATGEEGA